MPSKKTKPHDAVRTTDLVTGRRMQLPRKFKAGFLDELDASTPGVAKLRNRYALLVRHCAADTNVMKQVLCQRFTLIWMELESIEAELLQTSKRMDGRYTYLLNSLVGLAKTLGINEATEDTVDTQDKQTSGLASQRHAIDQWLAGHGLTATYYQDKQTGKVLNNGIRIKTQAADPNTVRGDTMVAAIVDEACFLGYQSDAKVKSDTELMRALEPSLATTQGKLIAISSTYAQKGWCYDEWRDCYGVEGADTLVWHATSRDMNPTLSEAWIAKRLAKDPVGARAEYLSVWRDDLVLLFTRTLVEDRVVTGRGELPPELAKGGQAYAHQYMGFVDLSGGRADASAVAIAHKEGGHVVLDYLEWWDAPHSPKEVVAKQAKILHRYGIRHVRGDNYAGEWPVDEFRGHGIRYERSPLVKNDLYHELVPIFTSGDITLLDCPRLVDELCLLERSVRTGGKDRIDHPQGGHDDVANALAGVATMCKPQGLVATADPHGHTGHGVVENNRQAMAAMLAGARQAGNGILHIG